MCVRSTEVSVAPAFSIIMPAFGTRAWIGEAIASVQAQTLTDWELIIVDDGSPDDLAEVVVPELVDTRITLVTQENAGAGAARNHGVAMSTGPLLTFVDSDDIIAPDLLARTAAAFDARPEVGIVGCFMERFDDVPGDRHGRTEPALAQFPRVWDAERCLVEFLRNPFTYHGATIRRTFFDAVGGYTPGLAIQEDFEVWLKVIAAGARPHILASPHYFWRERPESVTRSEAAYNVRLPESRALVLETFLRARDLTPGVRSVARAERATAEAVANLGSARAALRAGSRLGMLRYAARSFRARPSVPALRLLLAAPLPLAVASRIATIRSGDHNTS